MAKTYTVTISDKKKALKKQRRGKTLRVFATILVMVGILAACGYYLRKYVTSCEGDNCLPIFKPLLNTIQPKLDQTDGLTNVLIVGLDTRENNAGLMNTDTIIIATIDHNNKTVVLTSIPRDFWVRYKLPNGNYASSKINGAYANGEWYQKGKGVETLQGVVEEILDVEIHYYVKITLRGFIDTVDTIGGIDIDIPEYYKDAYPYEELPKELQETCADFYHGGHYCIFEFQEGVEHMDGLRALIYARCRLLSPKGDFDRAERQQRVIDAVKEEVLSSDTLLDPSKLWDLYNIVKENVENSSFTINDIRAVLNLRNEINPDEIGHVVIDPYLGHTSGKYVHRPYDYPSRGYYIEARDKTYEDIQELLEYIRKYPRIYNEEVRISIYNATEESKLETDWTEEIEKDHPLFFFVNTNRIIQNPLNQYEGISIYKFTEDDKPATEEYLKQFFGVNEIITDADDGTKALAGEDFVVVIGIQDSLNYEGNL